MAIARWRMFCLFALCAGCARAPVAEIAEYSGTYEQTRLAGDLMFSEYSRYALGEGEGGEASCAAVDPDFGAPTCFDAAIALGAADEPAQVAIRRLALNAIADYNFTLSNLASGVDARALRGRMDRVSRSVDLILGIVAPASVLPVRAAAEPLKTLAAGAKALVDSDRAARALIEDAPKLGNLIRALRDDAQLLYEGYFAAFRTHLDVAIRRVEILKRSGDQAAFEAAQEDLRRMSAPETGRLALFHATLTEYVRLLGRSEQMLNEIVAQVAEDQADPTVSSLRLARRAVEAEAASGAFYRAARRLIGASQWETGADDD